MTTETPTTTTRTSSQADKAADQAADAAHTARETVGEAAGAVRDAATEFAARIPEAASTTREALAEADRRMEAGSDEMLATGSTLAFGLALGLLLGGANRMLVALALVPAAAMGLKLFDRSRGSKGSRRVQGS